MILGRLGLNRENTRLIAGAAGDSHLAGVDSLGLLYKKAEFRKDLREIVPFCTGTLVIPRHKPYDIAALELVQATDDR